MAAAPPAAPSSAARARPAALRRRALLGGLLTAPLVVGPRDRLAADTGRSTGLPVPRFVSLRADKVNLRTGPGLRYPIDWVFQRRGLPVEVMDEFNAWRKIRTWDGTTGWVHGVMLDSTRTARVLGAQPRVLLSDPGPRGNPVAMVQPGAIGTLGTCRAAYCHVDFGRHAGWLRRAQIYGGGSTPEK